MAQQKNRAPELREIYHEARHEKTEQFCLIMGKFQDMATGAAHCRV